MNTLDVAPFLSRPLQTTQFEDSFSEDVWKTTYKDYKDTDINDTFWRVACAIASVEKTSDLQRKWSEKFYDMMTDFKCVPGGRILANAGTEFKGTTLINCFVLPNPKYDPDSIEGILEYLKYQSLTLKSEGGAGLTANMIRPRGSFIEGIGVSTPGAVKFFELFDKSSEIITSGSGLDEDNTRAKGKIRKGAQMLSLSCFHPDIIEFVTAKQTANRLSKFNVSVNCCDFFMKKVSEINDLKKAGASKEEIDKITWDLIFPDTSFHAYKTEWNGNFDEWKNKGYPFKVYKTVKVSWLWDLITKSTYNRNEPGILFLDRANYFNPYNYDDSEYISTTNPCAEQQMPRPGVCDIGSLNLTQFINEDRTDFDYEKISKYAKILTRFLDNVSTYSGAPLPEYIESMRNKRRIGCGLMGWGSSLFLLQLRFGSEKAKQIQEKVLKTFVHSIVEESIELAKELGHFKYCRPEQHVKSPYWNNINLPSILLERMKKYGIRNSSLFSMQPTGNTSVMAQIISGGIEPIFLPEYIRTVIISSTPEYIRLVTPNWVEGEWKETEMFKFAQEGDEQILRGIASDGIVFKIDRNRGLTKEVLCQDYAVRYLSARGLWNKNADWAITTDKLTVQEHIDDLTMFAKWVDSSISKTTNIPNKYPFKDFQNIYLDAYNTGYIKGITTYRQGSMTSVLSATEQKTEDEEIILQDIKMLDSHKAEIKVLRDYENSGKRKWYITVSLNENNAPIGIFVQTNALEKTVIANDTVECLMDLAKHKGIPKKYITSTIEKCEQDTNSTKIARAIGLLLRHGVKIKNVVMTLDKIAGVSFGSFVYQIKKLLSGYIKDGEIVEDLCCSSCNGKLIYESGCQRCLQCGGSKCS